MLSTALCFVGCVVCALAKSIGVLIGMRCVQAIGYVLLDTLCESPKDSPLLRSLSPVLSLGAATLADMYEPRERGTMMGIYYRSSK